MGRKKKEEAETEHKFDYGEKGESGQYERHPGLPAEFPLTQEVRYDYVHQKCKTRTRVPEHVAQSMARKQDFYNTTFCVGCKNYFPVGEFVWPQDGKPINKPI